MSDRQDDRFNLRPSAPRSKHSKQTTFVARVLNAAYKAGPVAGAVGVAKRSRPGPRHGRGRVAASFAGQSFGIRSRRVTIKVRHVQIRGNVRVTASHIRYLEREGVGADREPGKAYGRDTDQVDCKAFGEASVDDRHQFRMIVSAEDGAELEDQKSFTRSLMQQMEKDLQTRLDWIAVDHCDTGHPHTHGLALMRCSIVTPSMGPWICPTWLTWTLQPVPAARAAYRRSTGWVLRRK